jgi:DNA-binding XRE family transcriptional regulator
VNSSLTLRPMAVTSAQVRMARAALDWTVRDLAEATGLHRNTINNIEVGRYAGDPKTLEAIEKILRQAGVEFIDENGGGREYGSKKQSERQGKNKHCVVAFSTSAEQTYVKRCSRLELLVNGTYCRQKLSGPKRQCYFWMSVNAPDSADDLRYPHGLFQA